MEATKYPTVVNWNFTYWCNMNCRHCYSRKEAGKELSVSEYQNIARQIVEAKVLHVNFGGGESLGRLDLYQVAQYLLANDIGVSLSTNGWLVDIAVAKKLKEIGLRTATVSLNGGSSEAHDNFCRQQGAFNRILQAVKNLKEEKIYVRIATSVSKQSINEVEKIAMIATALKADELVFQSIKLSDQNVPVNEWAEAHQRMSEVKFANQTSSLKVTLDYLNDVKIAGILNKPIDGCPCGKLSCSIKPNGDVTPCVYVNKPIGNLMQTSLLEIWESAELLKTIRSRNLNACCDL